MQLWREEGKKWPTPGERVCLDYEIFIPPGKLWRRVLLSLFPTAVMETLLAVGRAKAVPPTPLPSSSFQLGAGNMRLSSMPRG